MATCTVRWRSSGGRGEFEYLPADSLKDREVKVFFEALNVTIPAEVIGVKANGKPRLRKLEKDNRKKFHLPQLVMAVARLPEPAREDVSHTVAFPLRNKSFVMDSMDFEVIDDDGLVATLAPLRVSIRHSDRQIDLEDRLNAIAQDRAHIKEIKDKHPELASAVLDHLKEILKAKNSTNIRVAADKAIAIQTRLFGVTNSASATKVEEINSLPPRGD